jgi:transglutaminase 1
LPDCPCHLSGSSQEREVFKLALSQGNKPNIYGTPDVPQDVQMGDVEIEDATIGAPIDIQVPFENQSGDARTVSIAIQVEVVYYTGVVSSVLIAKQEKFPLDAFEKHTLNLRILADEYLDRLVEQSALKVFVHGSVKETRQAFADEEVFRLCTPDMDVKLVEPAVSEIRIGSKVKVELQLKNPLDKNLTNCEMTVEGPGLIVATVLKTSNVGPGDTLTQTVEFAPSRSGHRSLIATFESDQLSQVTGELDITVAK